jgi:hypothetical protein
MKLTILLITVCFLLACESKCKDSNNHSTIVEVKIFKKFKNKKIKITNKEIDLFISFKDTLDSIRQFGISINSEKKKKVFIYKKNLLEKEYQDSETLLISNLESKFMFGKIKPICVASRPNYSTISENEEYNPKYSTIRFNGYEINFYESGRFIDTYYISFINTKNRFKIIYCTVRLRDIGENYILEKVVLRSQSLWSEFLIKKLFPIRHATPT